VVIKGNVFFLYFLLCIGVKANAQIDTNKVPISGFAIKILPSGLVDMMHAIYAFSYEQAISKSTTLNLEAGYINRGLLYRNINKNSPDQIIGGILLRPGIRFYFEDGYHKQRRLWLERNPGKSQPFYGNHVFRFIEIQSFFKSYFGTYSDWISVNCQDRNLRYQKFSEFKYNKTAYGLTVLIGVVQKDSLFKIPYLVEYYLGLGIRRRDYEISNFPENGCFNNYLNGVYGFKNAWYPNVQLGIRLGLEFKKR
jgi:hypothetical protein